MHPESKTSVALRCLPTLLAGAALLLAGCGQKGPLTLPAAAPAASAATASAATK